MKIEIIGKGVEITESMKKMTSKKLARVESFFDDDADLDAVVVYKVHPLEQSCEISITAPRLNIRAKTRGNDAYECLDLCIDKLEGQLRKVKTMYTKARDKSFGKSIKFDAIDNENEDPSVRVTKMKKLDLVPMDVDEAIARMDALGHSFFIYLDSETGLTNVLYLRENGEFGRIEIEKQ